MQNLRRVGKNNGPTLSRLWTKVHVVLRRCTRPLVVTNAFSKLPRCLCHVSFRRYRPLKLPLSCEVGRKNGFTPPICRPVPHTSDMPFQIALTFDRLWLSSVQRTWRVEGKNIDRWKNRGPPTSMSGVLISSLYGAPSKSKNRQTLAVSGKGS